EPRALRLVRQGEPRVGGAALGFRQPESRRTMLMPRPSRVSQRIIHSGLGQGLELAGALGTVHLVENRAGPRGVAAEFAHSRGSFRSSPTRESTLPTNGTAARARAIR